MFDEILHEPKTIAFNNRMMCIYLIRKFKPYRKTWYSNIAMFHNNNVFAFSNQDNTVIAMNLTQMAVLLF